MTLFIILTAWVIEHFAGVPDNMRNFQWFSSYVRMLENRCKRYPFWQGPGGVIITCAGPVFLIATLVWILLKLFYPMALVLSLLCLLYAMGPGYLNARLNDYIRALEDSDLARIQQLGTEFSIAEQGDQSDRVLLEGILVYAHNRLFGVLFWFMVLGPSGAVLYRLAAVLQQEQRDVPGGYGDSVRDLYNILNWPSSRLFALGNALTGSMVDAMEAWREAEQRVLTVNENVIRTSGIGALHYQPEDETEHLLEDRIYWVRALQAMLNRTLLAWLTILGLMTLSGWSG